MLEYKLAPLCAKLGTFWTEMWKWNNMIKFERGKVFDEILKIILFIYFFRIFENKIIKNWMLIFHFIQFNWTNLNAT